MKFGQAIELVKEGKLITREGWNEKGMFLFIRPEDNLPMEVVKKAVSIPDAVKDYFRKQCEESQLAKPVKVTAYLCMKAADNTIVNGWLASQTDILAEDWQEFKLKE